MTKMEANGFTMTMSPAIESIYKDDENEKKNNFVSLIHCNHKRMRRRFSAKQRVFPLP